MNTSPAESAGKQWPSAAPPRRRWLWLLLAAGLVVVAFFGYGQSELLLEAANLRYCG